MGVQWRRGGPDSLRFERNGEGYTKPHRERSVLPIFHARRTTGFPLSDRLQWLRVVGRLTVQRLGGSDVGLKVRGRTSPQGGNRGERSGCGGSYRTMVI